jgi:pyruvate kinase
MTLRDTLVVAVSARLSGTEGKRSMSVDHPSPRRVKIVATLGPASASADVVARLARAGADTFRLNAAHLAPDQIPPLVELVHALTDGIGGAIGVFLDLGGPKLRLAVPARATPLIEGTTVTLGDQGSAALLQIEGIDPRKECPPGSRVLLHDGRVVLRVGEDAAGVVRAEVVSGGEVAAGMGVNLPDVETSLPSLTSHDLECLAAALAAGVDACSLSFVRRAEDVADLRGRMAALGRVVPIIAKLEKAQAVGHDALRAILGASDAVMVARGDLGAETAPEKVPVLQKEILRTARAVGVPTITATEMLESMIHETRPTRAEAADVANAVFDGSDAVMLSAETAVGDDPVRAVTACARIISEAERHGEFRTAWDSSPGRPGTGEPVADAVAEAAAEAGDRLRAAAIICFTQTGRTARLVARHRPNTPILALTPRPEVARALSFVWGVEPLVATQAPEDHEEVVRLAERMALQHRRVAPGDLIVVTHGAPVVARPLTNLMRVHRLER